MGRAGALLALKRIVDAVLRGEPDAVLVQVCVSAAQEAMSKPAPHSLCEVETTPAPRASEFSVTVDDREVECELVDAMPSEAYCLK